MTDYYRPIPQVGPSRPDEAIGLADGWSWFTHVEVLSRDRPPRVCHATSILDAVRDLITSVRPPIAGLSFDRPRVMGILNTTPDSFSDGGQHEGTDKALAGAQTMSRCDILDIGGESTRPGAETIAVEDEIARTVPVISALRDRVFGGLISIDTRKAAVARAALDAGAGLVNDVSGFTFDADLARLCAERRVPVCVMHAQGDPQTMQDAPHYADVLLDVYDSLAARIDMLVALGIPRKRIIADPGIGFGKTLAHNLALLSRLSLFHGLGVPLLIGASRKRFIGTIAGVGTARDRMPGSVAVALAAVKHGTQIVRVHDVPETLQAIAVWQAVMAGDADE